MISFRRLPIITLRIIWIANVENKEYLREKKLVTGWRSPNAKKSGFGDYFYMGKKIPRFLSFLSRLPI
jgi:hypothetical protein